MKKLVIILLVVLPLATQAQWLTNGSNIYNSNTGNVGVGTSSPTSKIEILGDGVNSFPLLIKNNASSVIGVYSASGNATWHSGFFSYKARGTVAAPSDVISGDRISGYYALPYIGGAYRASAGMEFYVGSTPSATSFPTYMLFGTTPNNGTARLERMRITESGFVGINKTNPAYQLDVNGIINSTGVNVLSVQSGNTVAIKGVNYTTASGSPLLVGLESRVTVSSGNVWGLLGLVNTSSTVTSSAVGVYGSVSSPNSEQFAGYFNGRVGTNSVFQSSDARLKENIINIDSGALNKLYKIHPKEYNFKNVKGLNLPKGKQVGVLAQEIKEVFPELVIESIFSSTEITSGFDKGENSYLMVNYIGLIPYIIKGIQEQNLQIKELKKQISMIESQSQEILLKTSIAPHLVSVSPNPATDEIKVYFQLTADTNIAEIRIMDIQGNIVFRGEVNRDLGSIVISLQSMKSGLHIVSLSADNIIWDTKRVLISK